MWVAFLPKPTRMMLCCPRYLQRRFGCKGHKDSILRSSLLVHLLGVGSAVASKRRASSTQRDKASQNSSGWKHSASRHHDVCVFGIHVILMLFATLLRRTFDSSLLSSTRDHSSYSSEHPVNPKQTGLHVQDPQCLGDHSSA